MSYFAWPAELVDLINKATYENQLDLQTWEDFERRCSDELACQGRYFLSHGEQQQHQALVEGLRALGRHYRDCPADLQATLELSRHTSEFLQTLAAFRAGREQRHFLQIAPLDRLLVAGVATLQGRGDREVVAARCQPAFESVSRFAGLFEASMGELPAEVCRALKLGFKAVGGALTLFRLWLDEAEESHLRQAVVDLKHGGELLDYLAGWEREVEQTESFIFPVGGGEAATLMTLPHQGAEAFRQGPLRATREYWDEVSQMIVLNESDEPILEQVEAVMQELSECPSQRLPELCRTLEHLFAKTQSMALNLPEGDGPWHRLTQMLTVACGEGLPDILMIDKAQTLRESPYPSLAEAGRLMGNDFEPERCRQALRILLQSGPPAELEVANF